MKLPDKNIGEFAKELIQECSVSRESRRTEAAYWRSLFYTGTTDATIQAKHNRCYSLIDSLSSYLFSPADVKFDIEFEADETDEWADVAQIAARHLNREFSRRRCGIAFSSGVDLSLVEGCSFAKAVWGRTGYEPHIIRQQFMGVLREDIEDLDRQDAFTHSFYLTEAMFNRLIFNHPKRKEIMAKIDGSFDARAEGVIAPSFIHEMVIGGQQPLNRQPQSGSMGMMSVLGAPTPMLAPEVGKRLIRVDDVWVVNDKQNDWTTIRYVEAADLVIEGEDIHRNLSDIPHEQPFVKICANETPGYFWGRSELALVAEIQMLMNARINNVDTIFRLQARPPRVFTGFQGITEEKMKALLSPDGWMSESTPGAQQQSLAPQMPSNALEYIHMLSAFFDDAAGLTPILAGHGESGVRAGVHAQTLLKTSSPRLRDRALLIEGQCATYGDLWFKMSRAKDSRVFATRGSAEDPVAKFMSVLGLGSGKQFTLEQMPPDAAVTVDSHTSSPAFSDGNINLMFALAKAGAVEGDSLIETTHPPKEDVLIDRYRRKQEAQQKLLKEHPELLMKGRGRR